jgi:D-xylulose reductase
LTVHLSVSPTFNMENPSCLLYGPGDVRFENRPMPVIEDANDVIIRIAYVGVCGSDVCIVP